jgi:hypothetical protein
MIMPVNIKADLEELLRDFKWNIRGFIDTEGRIYPVPEIPQVITGIFEAMIMTRIVEPLKQKYKCKVVIGRPREYPQLTLYGGEIGEKKIAIDVKSARKLTNTRTTRMSLGSCAGYFRQPNRKMPGCVFPYGEYKEHWIIGILYTWHPSEPSELYQHPSRLSEELVSDVEVIINEKWRIASRHTATGDTAAMGTIGW